MFLEMVIEDEFSENIKSICGRLRFFEGDENSKFFHGISIKGRAQLSVFLPSCIWSSNKDPLASISLYLNHESLSVSFDRAGEGSVVAEGLFKVTVPLRVEKFPQLCSANWTEQRSLGWLVMISAPIRYIVVQLEMARVLGIVEHLLAADLTSFAGFGDFFEIQVIVGFVIWLADEVITIDRALCPVLFSSGGDVVPHLLSVA
ncbi:hypothetical protein Tco_0016020 [Tanacetum coccineum]